MCGFIYTDRRSRSEPAYAQTKGTGVILMFGSHLTGVCFFFRGRPTGRSVAQTPCLSAIFSVH